MTEETLFHFFLECPSLEEIRGPIMQEILDVVHDVQQSTGQLSIGQDLTQLIVDCTVLTHMGDERGVKPELLQRLQYHSGRRVYGLHALRYTRYKIFITNFRPTYGAYIQTRHIMARTKHNQGKNSK